MAMMNEGRELEYGTDHRLEAHVIPYYVTV